MPTSVGLSIWWAKLCPGGRNRLTVHPRGPLQVTFEDSLIEGAADQVAITVTVCAFSVKPAGAYRCPERKGVTNLLDLDHGTLNGLAVSILDDDNKIRLPVLLDACCSLESPGGGGCPPVVRRDFCPASPWRQR